jgi:hypothetical protein
VCGEFPCSARKQEGSKGCWGSARGPNKEKTKNKKQKTKQNKKTLLW